MTRIKICGLTRVEDAVAAAEAGADALGFVFAPRSKRRADPAVVATVRRELPPFVTLVGVFQDQTLPEVREIFDACGLDVAQLHGVESAAYVESLQRPALKAIALGCAADVGKLAAYPQLRTFLLDAATAGEGRVFDWEWARQARRQARIVLAGGLGPENVCAAVEVVRPYAVDVASGVESAPGIKSAARMRAFVQAVREADLGLGETPFSQAS